MRDYQLPSEVDYYSLNLEELIDIILRAKHELEYHKSHDASWAIERAALAIGHRLFYTENKPDEWC